MLAYASMNAHHKQQTPDNQTSPTTNNKHHRFLLALVDPSPAVRQLAEYLLRDVLAVKAPLLAYNHFVEAIFVLNGCTAGLHGARLGANLGHTVIMPSTGVGVGDGGGAGEGGGGEGGQEGGEGGGVTAAAAPAQFTLKGKANRCECNESEKVGLCVLNTHAHTQHTSVDNTH